MNTTCKKLSSIALLGCMALFSLSTSANTLNVELNKTAHSTLQTTLNVQMTELTLALNIQNTLEAETKQTIAVQIAALRQDEEKDTSVSE